jgi:flavin reductase (DIM6/NTAB) family NADH-FMN oxidoreductase RutF
VNYMPTQAFSLFEETVPPAHVTVADVKSAMRTLGGGVSVITAGLGAERSGATVTSATAFSMDPPTMIVNINLSSSTWPIIRQFQHFCVNILTPEQKHIADRFAGVGGLKGPDRYQGAEWKTLISGAAVLAQAQAALDCVVEEVIERHSHAIIIGRIVAVEHSQGASLIYSNGQYGRFQGLTPG